MSQREPDYNKPVELPIEGRRGVDALVGLAAHLGYDTYPQQLTNNDGHSISGLLNMLEDNPGLIETMFNWVEDHREVFDELLDEEEDEEDSEEESEDVEES